MNSGVLVIDLDRWRSMWVQKRLYDYIRRYGDLLAIHDQDALNAVFQGDIALLDPRWNLQPRMLGLYSRSRDREGHRQAVRARKNPGIVHFTTSSMPWVSRVSVRDRRLYFRYQARTAWRGTRPQEPNRGQLEYDVARDPLAVGVDVYRIGAGFALAGHMIARRLSHSRSQGGQKR